MALKGQPDNKGSEAQNPTMHTNFSLRSANEIFHGRISQNRIHYTYEGYIMCFIVA